MNPKTIATTFVAVFLAELGDKTQLATLSLSSTSTSRLSVFLGSALALVTTSALGVLAGSALTEVASPATIRRAAGLLFVALGAMMLFTRAEG